MTSLTHLHIVGVRVCDVVEVSRTHVHGVLERHLLPLQVGGHGRWGLEETEKGMRITLQIVDGCPRSASDSGRRQDLEGLHGLLSCILCLNVSALLTIYHIYKTALMTCVLLLLYIRNLCISYNTSN